MKDYIRKCLCHFPFIYFNTYPYYIYFFSLILFTLLLSNQDFIYLRF